MLCGAAMACWSSDTLFIQLTSTPVPTPVPPTSTPAETGATLYAVGDSVTIVAQGAVNAIFLTRDPEPVTRRNRVPNGVCYPQSVVEIEGAQTVDSVTYYQVSCNGTSGWLPENNFAAE
jgi:hypothetical protein